jgi:ZIP family zinc transporter
MILEAIALGGLAQLSLLLSGLFATWVAVPMRIIGGIAGFGAGALISAITFDLTAQAVRLGVIQLGLWLLLGAIVFIAGDYAIDRWTGPGNAAGASPDGNGSGGTASGSSGAGEALGIVLGSVVDGVPESLIFGIGVAAGNPVSVAFLSAVIVSNVPQALAPSAELAHAGWSRAKLALMWGVVVGACALAAGLGFLLGSIGHATGDRMSALAAGGLLAMLTDSLMPFAFTRGGRYAGFWTVVGYALAILPRAL